MSSKAGIRLAVDGEADFKKALNDINSSMKVLGSEMQEVTSRFALNADSEEALTEKQRVLAREIEEQNKKVETLRDVLDATAKQYGENDAATQKWQVELNKAQTVLNKMQNQMTTNERALGELSRSEGEAAEDTDELGDALEDAADTAEKSGVSFSGLGSVVKTAGTAIAAAGAAIGAALISAGAALADMTVNGAAYADTVLTEATVTGIAADRLQEYMYAAELVDVSTETLTGSMAKQIKSMKAVQDGTKLSVEAYERLGVSVLNADGSLKDSDTVYWEVIDALGKVSNETERDALAMQILGKSAQDLNPIITAGAGRMAELGEQAHAAGYVLSDEMLTAYGALDDQLQYLNNGAEAAKNALGTALLPILTELSGEGVDLLNQFAAGIRDADGDIGQMTEVVGELLPQALDAVNEHLPELLGLVGTVLGALGQELLDHLPEILATVGDILGEVAAAVVDALPELAAGAVDLVVMLADGISKNLSKLASAAVQMVQAVADGLTEAFPVLLPAVVGGVAGVCAEILNQFPTIMETVIDLLVSVQDGILASIPALLDALPEIITGIVNGLLRGQAQMIEAGVKLIGSLLSDTPEILAGLARALPEIMLGLIDTILNYGTDMIEAGAELFSRLFDDPGAVLADAWDWIKEICLGIVNGLGDGFRSSWANMSEVGRNLLEGLWNGILAAKDWIVQKFKNLGADIKDGFCDFFGIHSPSREMEWVGQMLTAGLAGGITETTGRAVDAAKAMSRDIRGAVDGLSADMGLTVRADAFTPAEAPHAPYGGTDGNGPVTVEVNIQNFNNYTDSDIDALTERIMESAGEALARKGAIYA